MAIRRVFTPSATADVVAILDEQGNQVFSGARALGVSISSEIKYMTHPVDTGGNVTDHRIILPDVITLAVILTPEAYRSTYQEVRQAARNSTALIVQTKANTFENMRIAQYPTEEDPALFNTITMNIGLREIQFDNPRTVLLPQASVANPADTSTVDRGEQPVQQPSASVASRGLDSLRSFNQ